GLRASTQGGEALVDAPSAYVALDGHRLAVTLRSPRFTFDPDRYRGGPGWPPDASLDLRVTNGTLTVVAGAVPEPVVAFDAIGGTLHASGPRARYDVTLALTDRARRYPVSGRSVTDSDGSVS